MLSKCGAFLTLLHQVRKGGSGVEKPPGAPASPINLVTRQSRPGFAPWQGLTRVGRARPLQGGMVVEGARCCGRGLSGGGIIV